MPQWEFCNIITLYEITLVVTAGPTITFSGPRTRVQWSPTHTMSEYLKVVIDIYPGSPASPKTHSSLNWRLGDMLYLSGHWQAWVMPWAQGRMEAEPGARIPWGWTDLPTPGIGTDLNTLSRAAVCRFPFCCLRMPRLRDFPNYTAPGEGERCKSSHLGECSLGGLRQAALKHWHFPDFLGLASDCLLHPPHTPVSSIPRWTGAPFSFPTSCIMPTCSNGYQTFKMLPYKTQTNRKTWSLWWWSPGQI